MRDFLHQIIGSDSDTILWRQMVCHGTLIFFYTLTLIRIFRGEASGEGVAVTRAFAGLGQVSAKDSTTREAIVERPCAFHAVGAGEADAFTWAFSKRDQSFSSGTDLAFLRTDPVLAALA